MKGVFQLNESKDAGLHKPSRQDPHGSSVDTHFRVTLGHDRHPHKIVSVWAADRHTAKLAAADENPEWEVVQARVSNHQTRSEEA